MNGQIHSLQTCPAVTDVLLRAFKEHRRWNPELKPMEFMNRRWKDDSKKTAYAEALHTELGRDSSGTCQ